MPSGTALGMIGQRAGAAGGKLEAGVWA